MAQFNLNYSLNSTFIEAEEFDKRVLLGTSPVLSVSVSVANINYKDSLALSKIADDFRTFINKKYGKNYKNFLLRDPEIENDRVNVIYIQLQERHFDGQ